MQSRAERSAGAVMAKMALLEVSASIPPAVLGLPTLIESFFIIYFLKIRKKSRQCRGKEWTKRNKKAGNHKQLRFSQTPSETKSLVPGGSPPEARSQ